ncbi:protein SCARECROW-like [Salvia miltiorrhiza]|uniref:protein SCARECROW-like n=1 Tax=Salvia miltiorrhiza TaxID=226208 RepID=UPI0025ABAE42|nr:protein SCARECROW-like [Salvia miltiorrhiza]
MQPQEQLNYSGNLFSEHLITKTSDRSDQLSQWVEHVTKQLIEDLPETDHDLTPTYDDGGATVAALLGELSPIRKAARKSSDDSPGSTLPTKVPADEVAMSLLTLLFECAVAISLDNLGEAHRMLLELSQTASPYGASSAERVVAYFAKAMSSRVVNSWIGVCAPIHVDFKAVHAAFHVYNNVSPFVKFAHFTSNQAILEACSRHSRLHIVDLDIMQGLQWPALFHILATRAEGAPYVRMTGLGSSMELLLETGKQLSSFARRLGMQFEFHAVEKKFGDVADVSALGIRRGDTLAVHWLQHSLYDATGPDWKTMRLLQGLRPRVVTLVEQEIAHGGSFLDRFVASLHYYSTMFDSLGAFLAGEDAGRHRVEQWVLHREINNVLAVGGPARSGEDKFRNWRSELAGSGFVQMGMSGNAMAQAQLILNMFPAARGYRLVQGDHGTLSLGWKDTSLYTASAWTSPNHHLHHMHAPS